MMIRARYVDCDTNIVNAGTYTVTSIEDEDIDEEVAPALTLGRIEYDDATQELFITGTRTDEIAAGSLFPPGTESDVNHGRSMAFGRIREVGYWQETGTDDFFTEYPEWSFSRLTGILFSTPVRLYLSLEPVFASGSNLYDSPAHVFNGVKA
ncbi:MAG: hypothetical protein RIE56_01205, partial [Amphiplicatus sp.]